MAINIPLSLATGAGLYFPSGAGEIRRITEAGHGVLGGLEIAPVADCVGVWNGSTISSPVALTDLDAQFAAEGLGKANSWYWSSSPFMYAQSTTKATGTGAYQLEKLNKPVAELGEAEIGDVADVGFTMMVRIRLNTGTAGAWSMGSSRHAAGEKLDPNWYLYTNGANSLQIVVRDQNNNYDQCKCITGGVPADDNWYTIIVQWDPTDASQHCRIWSAQFPNVPVELPADININGISTLVGTFRGLTVSCVGGSTFDNCDFIDEIVLCRGAQGDTLAPLGTAAFVPLTTGQKIYARLDGNSAGGTWDTTYYQRCWEGLNSAAEVKEALWGSDSEYDVTDAGNRTTIDTNAGSPASGSKDADNNREYTIGTETGQYNYLVAQLDTDGYDQCRIFETPAACAYTAAAIGDPTITDISEGTEQLTVTYTNGAGASSHDLVLINASTGAESVTTGISSPKVITGLIGGQPYIIGILARGDGSDGSDWGRGVPDTGTVGWADIRTDIKTALEAVSGISGGDGVVVDYEPHTYRIEDFKTYHANTAGDQINGWIITRTAFKDIEEDSGFRYQGLHRVKITAYYGLVSPADTEKTFQDLLDTVTLAIRGSVDIWDEQPEGETNAIQTEIVNHKMQGGILVHKAEMEFWVQEIHILTA